MPKITTLVPDEPRIHQKESQHTGCRGRFCPREKVIIFFQPLSTLKTQKRFFFTSKIELWRIESSIPNRANLYLRV